MWLLPTSLPSPKRVGPTFELFIPDAGCSREGGGASGSLAVGEWRSTARPSRQHRPGAAPSSSAAPSPSKSSAVFRRTHSGPRAPDAQRASVANPLPPSTIHPPAPLRSRLRQRREPVPLCELLLLREFAVPDVPQLRWRQLRSYVVLHVSRPDDVQADRRTC